MTDKKITLLQLDDILAALNSAADGLGSSANLTRRNEVLAAHIVARRHYSKLAYQQHVIPDEDFDKIATGVRAAVEILLNRRERSDVDAGVLEDLQDDF